MEVPGGTLAEGIHEVSPRQLSMSTSLASCVDALGAMSQEAQGLRRPVTTAANVRMSQHTLLVACERSSSGRVLSGLLKAGRKKLFLRDGNSSLHECTTLCLLDFFVAPPSQRHGLGKALLDRLLLSEKLEPCDLALDRPSERLLAFFRKHYCLFYPSHQENHFVVFPSFWSPESCRRRANYNAACSPSPSLPPDPPPPRGRASTSSTACNAAFSVNLKP